MMPATADPIDEIEAVVLGSGTLLVQLIGHVLSSAGVQVLPSGEHCVPNIAVLVEPDRATWAWLDNQRVPAVVVVENEPDAHGVVGLVSAGAHAILPTTCDQSDLVGMVRRVASGESGLTRVQSRLLVDGVQARARREDLQRVDITAREDEILRAIDQGMSVKQTARSLGISPRTVENTQRLLFRKLGVRNRAQAVARAHALALLPTYDRSGNE